LRPISRFAPDNRRVCASIVKVKHQSRGILATVCRETPGSIAPGKRQDTVGQQEVKCRLESGYSDVYYAYSEGRKAR
jgi:hypothetical protein